MSVHITVNGNVGNDVEEFTFGNDGRGIRFDVASTDTIRGEQKTTWYKVACFGRVAEAAQEHMQTGRLTKGSQVLIMGAFKPRDYQTKNGDDRVSLDVTASTLEILRWPDNRQQATPDDDYMDDEDASAVPF